MNNRKASDGGSFSTVTVHHQAVALAHRIRDALDPVKVPSKVKALAEMSPEEVAALEARHGAAVKPRAPGEAQRRRRLRLIARLARRRQMTETEAAIDAVADEKPNESDEEENTE